MVKNRGVVPSISTADFARWLSDDGQPGGDRFDAPVQTVLAGSRLLLSGLRPASRLDVRESLVGVRHRTRARKILVPQFIDLKARLDQ